MPRILRDAGFWGANTYAMYNSRTPRNSRSYHRKGGFGHTPVRMDDSVYALRRQVIEVIYEANRRLPVRLPRIEVRVVDGGSCHVAGYAWMGCNIVHIPKATFGSADLVQVVLHELLHAVLSTEHDDDCPLMCPCIDKSLTNERAWELFLGYF